MTPTMHHSGVLWRYLTAPHGHHGNGLLVVCGSYDLRVCDYACDLYMKGRYEHFLITGKSGNWTDQIWTQTEAEIFAARARSCGIPKDALLLEHEATNFAENIRNARRLVPDERQVTFLTKRNSIRRVLATAPIQWPGIEVRADGPPIIFPDEVSNIVGVFGLISEMVGDIDRLLRYPDLGFQVRTEVPEDVHASYVFLASHGFGDRLIQPTKQYDPPTT